MGAGSTMVFSRAGIGGKFYYSTNNCSRVILYN